MLNNYLKNNILVILSFLVFTSCGGRNPGVSEKQIVAIMSDSSSISSDENIQQSPDTDLVQKNIPAGVKYTESRAIDPAYPPVIIDIEGSLTNKKAFKLSEFASSIRYIKLSAQTDSTALTPAFRGSMGYAFYKNKIITDGLLGIYLFSEEGKLTDTIYRNNATTISKSMHNGNQMAMIKDSDNFAGKRMCIMGNKLLYLSKKDEFNSKSPLQLTIYNLDKTIKEKIIPINSKKNYSIDGIKAVSSNSFCIIYKTLFTDEQYMLRTFGIQGDTLCQFTNYEIVKDFKAQSYSPPEESWDYSFQNAFTFRQSCNDTVYRVSDNKLLPVYILKLGKYKISLNDAVREKNTDNKIRLGNCIETPDYLFIEYSQYIPKNERKKDKHSTHHRALYNKKNKQFTINESSSKKIQFENNLDNNVDFWPQFITDNGEMGMIISKRLMSIVVNKNPNEAGKWEKLTADLGDNDVLLMLVK